MRQWATTVLPVPEVGFELADDKGEVHAETELAWPSERVAVLHGGQEEHAAAFEQAGWRAYPAGDDVPERVVNGLTA